MKKLKTFFGILFACTCLIFLASCGKEKTESKPAATNQEVAKKEATSKTNGEPMETDEVSEQLMMTDDIVPFSDESFLDNSLEELYGDYIDDRHSFSVSEKDGYVYALVAVDGGSGYTDRRLYLSVAKDGKWLFKGKRVPINQEDASQRFTPLGDKVLTVSGGNVKLITLNQNGDVEKETKIPFTSYSVVQTSKGAAIVPYGHDKLVVLDEPENIIDLKGFGKAVDEEQANRLYFNLDENTAYLDIEKSGSSSLVGYDLTKDEKNYDANGQVVKVPVKTPGETFIDKGIVGQNAEGDLYYLQLDDHNREVYLALLDKKTLEIKYESKFGIQVENTNSYMIDNKDEFHLWGEIQFKDKPSLQMVKISK